MTTNNNEWDADLYSKKHDFVYKYGKDLIDLLQPKEDELILDLGCGTGQLTHEIGKSGADVIGIDASEKMIKAAKENYPNIEFYIKKAADFQFDTSFDAIFSNAVLHWVLKREAAVVCMCKNLKKHGRLVLEFGGKGNVRIILHSVKKILLKAGYPEKAKIRNWYFPSISEYTTLLENNGFEVELAQLYERPTELSDRENGIKDWLKMFGTAFFKDMHLEERDRIIDEIQEDLRDKCYINGKWFADYKRIRILAVKK